MEVCMEAVCTEVDGDAELIEVRKRIETLEKGLAETLSTDQQKLFQEFSDLSVLEASIIQRKTVEILNKRTIALTGK